MCLCSVIDCNIFFRETCCDWISSLGFWHLKYCPNQKKLWAALKLLSLSQTDGILKISIRTQCQDTETQLDFRIVTKQKSNLSAFVVLQNSLGCFHQESSILQTSCHKFFWGWLVAQSGISSYGVCTSGVHTVFWTQSQSCSGKPWGNDDYT